MEVKYKQFSNFDWTKSSEWQSYYTNLFPTPAANKIDYYKRKFYRLKIDNDFDVNYFPPVNNSSSNTNNNYSSSSFSTNYTPPSPTHIENKNISLAEAFVWLIFIQSILFQFHTLKLAAIALLLRTYNRVGIIKFSMEFAQILFLDEHFQLLLYSLLFMIERFNYFVLLPLLVTAILNLSYFISKYGSTLPTAITNSIKPYSEKILAKRVELAKARSNIEIAIGFLLVIGILFGINSFLTPIFYWQYMRFKYIVNEDIKAAFTRLNQFINQKKVTLPSVFQLGISKIQQFAEYMGRTESGPGQNAGGSNCIIF